MSEAALGELPASTPQEQQQSFVPFPLIEAKFLREKEYKNYSPRKGLEGEKEVQFLAACFSSLFCSFLFLSAHLA